MHWINFPSKFIKKSFIPADRIASLAKILAINLFKYNILLFRQESQLSIYQIFAKSSKVLADGIRIRNHARNVGDISVLKIITLPTISEI